ncbi:hypothetical protein AX762_11425 [Alkalibacterium sp. 20]|nr:hypothetical protein AX762_11425 [Alkalibacterium sp. 20]
MFFIGFGIDNRPVGISRYSRSGASERWKTYLVDGKEYIPNTFEKALNTLNKAIDKLLSKIHQRLRTIKKSVGLSKQPEPHQEGNRALNKRLDELVVQNLQKKMRYFQCNN